MAVSKPAKIRIAPSKMVAQQVAELEAENATLRERAAALQAEHAEAQNEAQRSLAKAIEREGVLVTLLSSAGANAQCARPIDWSIAEAQEALQQDVAHQAFLDR